MVVKTRRELRFVLQADMMMNRGRFKNSFRNIIRNFLIPDDTMSFLRVMRKLSYYNYKKNRCALYFLPYVFYLRKFYHLSVKLGFSIGYDTLGYGVVLPHHGTIVVGASNYVGNYAVLQTSTCITDNEKTIGDGLYLSTGVVITNKVNLGNGISIGANSIVNKECIDDNVMLAGQPAVIKKHKEVWYNRAPFEERHDKIEQLRNSYVDWSNSNR